MGWSQAVLRPLTDQDINRETGWAIFKQAWIISHSQIATILSSPPKLYSKGNWAWF